MSKEETQGGKVAGCTDTEEDHPFYDGLEECIPYSYTVEEGESTTAMTILHNHPAVKGQEVDHTKEPSEVTLYIDSAIGGYVYAGP